MKLSEVMDHLAEAVNSIEGLTGRTSAHPVSNIQPPAAVVSYPEDYSYDVNQNRGADRMTVPVVIFVGNVVDRAARDEVDDFLAGAGARSMKEAIDGFPSGGVYDVATVQTAEFDIITLGAIDYLAVTFSVDVVGSGT